VGARKREREREKEGGREKERERDDKYLVERQKARQFFPPKICCN